jgi:hypothetical protein
VGVELASDVSPVVLAVSCWARSVADVRGERARVSRVVGQDAEPFRGDAEFPGDVAQLGDVSQGLGAFLQLGQPRLRGVKFGSHVLLGQLLVSAVPADDLPHIRAIRRRRRSVRHLQPAHEAPVRRVSSRSRHDRRCDGRCQVVHCWRPGRIGR